MGGGESEAAEPKKSAAVHMNEHGGCSAGVQIELTTRVFQPPELKFVSKIPK